MSGRRRASGAPGRRHGDSVVVVVHLDAVVQGLDGRLERGHPALRAVGLRQGMNVAAAGRAVAVRQPRSADPDGGDARRPGGLRR